MQEILEALKSMQWSVTEGETSFSAPSNIALIKYWGKYEGQLPANPSISMTLNSSRTETSIRFSPGKTDGEVSIGFSFEGERNVAFEDRIRKFLTSLVETIPVLNQLHLEIDSSNSFPHSSGIASSASSMAALAMNLVQIVNQLSSDPLNEHDSLTLASYLARLGSGSACRSIYGGYAVWGQSEFFENSSDLFARPLVQDVIHETFRSFNDDILIIEKGAKKVSSSAGHGLMKNHPLAATRFDLARERMGEIKKILQQGDLEAFGQIVENEALMLHSMMLTSNPPYILFKPNTLQVIESVWDFRKETGIPLFFTLDAGANVHLLYPSNFVQQIRDKIKQDLVAYCEKGLYLCDGIGQGPFANKG